MNVSAKTEYACAAVFELAASYGTGNLLQVRKIAEAHQIPAKFLVQILLQLKAAGLVVSTRGAYGGYRLARDPSDVTVWDVFSVVEGESQTRPTQAGRLFGRVLNEVWQQAAERSRAGLQAITYAELLERADSQAMYYI